MILSGQADRIRGIRALLQMSQRQLARDIGVTQATVSKWETGGGIHPKRMNAVEELVLARDRLDTGPPPLLRLEAATLARDLLAEAKAGALVSRPLVDRARNVIHMCERI